MPLPNQIDINLTANFLNFREKTTIAIVSWIWTITINTSVKVVDPNFRVKINQNNHNLTKKLETASGIRERMETSKGAKDRFPNHRHPSSTKI